MTNNLNIQTGKHETITEDLYWLTSIKASKGEKRVYITHIYVKDGVMFKTDGHRIHRLKTDRDFTNGFYSVLKRTKSEMVLGYYGNEDFGVFPEGNGLMEKPDGVELVVSRYGGDSSKAFTEIIRNMDKNTLRYSFLDDVLSDDGVYIVTIKDSELPIHFENGNKTAIIMPIKL